jgi:Fe-S cluster assembly iron-binding protein IscA
LEIAKPSLPQTRFPSTSGHSNGNRIIRRSPFILIDGGFTIMLTVTKKAAAFLKVAKAAEGATRGAGIRLRRDAILDQSGKPSVGFTFSDEPDPDDWEFEQEGLRIFVEGALVEPLDGRTLDVRDANDGLQLVFR